ncbi:response regulator transcription factor [Actinomycetospora sp. TBRC 11914]|uniref:response regulator transcription factor n=1 Tax=Actinomycetospora sp. TBRC 11914 TaxID=2729387 RepID=UPI00145CF3A1|nr:response regulator transcription factor [Actinomycetospora sp. TBRC 11914]NMO92393.1 response regulator transcription factor [Actinomycetospora sp. TBRC 11914]
MSTVVVGDDHGVFVDALSTVLGQRRLDVRAVAHRACDVLAAVTEHRPAVCLLDRTFADGDGLDLIPDLLAASADTRIVMVTADPDVGGVQRALDLGARGFVHKTRGISALVDAIHRVLDGEVALELPPRRRATAACRDDDDVRRLAAHLTAREWECLRLMVEGRGTSEIAAGLGISRTTVRTHVQAVLTKLGVHTRLEAAALAARHGLVTSPSAP